MCSIETLDYSVWVDGAPLSEADTAISSFERAAERAYCLSDEHPDSVVLLVSRRCHYNQIHPTREDDP